MKALKNNVVYEPIVEEKKTESGIIIPGSQNKPFDKGVVKYVGPEASQKEPDLVPGATVLVSKGSSTDIELDEKQLKIVKDEGIILIL